MSVRTTDFESVASANSATRPGNFVSVEPTFSLILLSGESLASEAREMRDIMGCELLRDLRKSHNIFSYRS